MKRVGRWGRPLSASPVAVWLVLAAVMLAGLGRPAVVLAGSTPPWPSLGGSLPNDGALGWIAPGEPPAGSVAEFDGALGAAPVTMDGLSYFVQHGNKLSRLDQGAGLVWSVTVGRVDSRGIALGPDSQGQLQVYVASADPVVLRCYAAATGALRWSKLLGSIPGGAPVVTSAADVVFGSEDGKVRSYSSSGVLRFQTAIGSQLRTRPAVGADGSIYVTSRAGSVACLNAAGQQQWRVTVGAEILRPPAVDAAGAVYVTDAMGRAWRFGPGGAVQYQTPVGAVTAGPVLCPDGTAVYGLSDGTLKSVSPAGLVAVRLAAGVIPVGLTELYRDEAGGLLYTSGQRLGLIGAGGAAAWHLDLPQDVTQVAWLGPGHCAAGLAGAGAMWLAPSTPAGPGLELPQLPVIAPLTEPAPSGWHRGRPVIGLCQEGLSSWPADWPLSWEATAGDVTEFGAIAPGESSFVLPLAGRVAVRLVGGSAREALGPWLEVAVDLEGPLVTLCHPNPAVPLVSGATVVPEVLVADSLSGVAGFVVTHNGVQLESWFTATPGRHQLSILATDNAGNQTVVTMALVAGEPSTATCLNGVLAGPRASASIPVWSRWVTVILRVPSAAGEMGAPQDVRLAGVPGVIVGRLPALTATGQRSYLARFVRTQVLAGLDSLVAVEGLGGRLLRLEPELRWTQGGILFTARATILYRP